MCFEICKKLVAVSLFILPCQLFAQSNAHSSMDLTSLETNSIIAESNHYHVPRINGTVELDGFSNEEAWEGIKPVEAVKLRPEYGGASSELTEMLIAYDENYIYIAGRLYQKDPSKILGNSQKRDSDDGSSDWFGIAIDSYNDNENVLAFYTTPTGLRWDCAVSNDYSGSSDFNVNWNTYWEVETQVTDEGWFAEMRIPFSSLRYQNKDGRVVMGIHLKRDINSKSERVTFPILPQEWQFKGSFKASLAQKVIFENIKEHNPIYVTPYFMGGFGHNAELTDNDNSYYKKKLTNKEFGVDLKYGVTNNLTLDVTVNTDFAQIEADDKQVNLSRYSLFFPEKRVFFQERESNLSFNLESSDQNRLFHSRRIGINNGRTVRIYGGARLVGRIGEWDIGALNMQTAAQDDLPSENFGVLRIRKQVINPYSYAGGIITSRLGDDGNYNYAVGLDGIFRVFGDDYLTVKTAQTFDKGKPNNIFSLKNNRIRINWQRRSTKGFGYAISYSRAGSDYNPGIGYEKRYDYTYFGTGFWYGWYPGEDAAILIHSLSFNSKLILKNSNGEIESGNAGLTWDVDGKSGYWGRIKSNIYYENVPEAFSLSDNVEVTPGRYTFADLDLRYDSPYNSDFFYSASISAGSFYDGWKVSNELDTKINVTSSLQMGGNYQFNKVWLHSGDQSFNVHIVKVRALYMLNTEFSVSAFVQYSNLTNTVGTNIRLRYNPGEGHDLYLVYNETLNTNRFAERPYLPASDNRTFLLKYTYTLKMF